MDIHKPTPWNGWREFLKECAIILVGMLTALSAEQAVEALQSAHKLLRQALPAVRSSPNRQGSDAWRIGALSCLDPQAGAAANAFIRDPPASSQNSRVRRSTRLGLSQVCYSHPAFQALDLSGGKMVYSGVVMNRSVFMGIKGLLIAASWAVGCGSAFAQVGGGAVPLPPSFSESVTSTSFSTGISSTQSGSGPYDVTNGFATAGTSYTLATEGEASLTIDAGSALAQQASASVIWNFVVIGPPNQSTFVFLQGRGDVKVVKPLGDLSIDDAQAGISGDAFQLPPADQSSNGEQRFGISLGAYLRTNTVYTIIETLSAYSFPLNGTTDLVHASFDPTVSLGDTSGVYSIALSAEPVPVPEPATWAMMLAGFGLVGFGLRSSRKQAVTALAR
jgi:hypothetical protein